jgi:Rieske Fe-S protein
MTVTPEDSPAGEVRSGQSAASRRTVLAGAGAAGLAATGLAGALAGCSTYGNRSGGGNDQKQTDQNPTGQNPTGNPAAAAFAKVADIPVGGGKVFEGQGIVVTQPQQGTIKAFSAACTHQGCTVSDVSGGTINCPCHGSRFKVADGSVASGPATRPLTAVKVTVDGDSIKLP